MSIINELAERGLINREDVPRGSSDTPWTRLHAELCDPYSQLSQDVHYALGQQARNYSAVSQRVVGS